jgi:hypothetical protein
MYVLPNLQGQGSVKYPPYPPGPLCWLAACTLFVPDLLSRRIIWSIRRPERARSYPIGVRQYDAFSRIVAGRTRN